MHIRLLFSGITVIHQRHAEVKILRLLSGQLAVRDGLVPLQLHAGVVLFHNECTHTEAGLVVLVVRDGTHGIDARLIRRAEGHADTVKQAGELIERLVELDERVDVDAGLLEQILYRLRQLVALGDDVTQELAQLADRRALLHHLRERLLAKAFERFVNELNDRPIGQTLGQLHKYAAGHIAGHAAEDREDIEIIGRIGGDEVLAELFIGIDARRVHLDGDLRLFHGQIALNRRAGTVSLIALEGHADLLIACAHLGIG